MPRDPVRELVQDLRSAYEAHDHDAHEAHLARLQRLFRYTGPVPERSSAKNSPEVIPGVDPDVTAG